MIIIIVISIAAAVALTCYASCVVAGTADDKEEELFNKWLEKRGDKNGI
jgi:hypothetical protein